MDMQPNEIINYKLDNGHISLHRYSDNPSEIILSSLLVRKQRRNGNGIKLMLRAEQIAKGLGCVRVFLEAKKGSWQEKWYERLGYNYCECCQERSGLIWMKKNLDKWKNTEYLTLEFDDIGVSDKVLCFGVTSKIN